MHKYLHGDSKKHTKICAANRAKSLLQQISCSCVQCGVVERPDIALDEPMMRAMDELLSACTKHSELMPGDRELTKSGMRFSNPLSETGFKPNENFLDCKLVAAHSD